MKIRKAKFFAEGRGLLMRFVIAGENPGARAERLHDFAAAIESLAEVREVTGGDVDVGGTGDEFFELAGVAVNVAEDEDFHLLSFARGGRILDMRRTLRPSDCQPSSTRLPEESKTTR